MSRPTHCDRPMRKNGITASGAQRYRCGCCPYTWVDTENTHGGHRHGVKGRTAADRSRASRQRTGKTGNEARARTRAKKTEQD